MFFLSLFWKDGCIFFIKTYFFKYITFVFMHSSSLGWSYYPQALSYFLNSHITYLI
jgi:hypothetical protein